MIADRLSPHAPLVLRLSVGLVFAYFGWTSLLTPEMWSGYVPEWTGAYAAAETLVRFHGALEITLGAALALGVGTRAVALFLCLDLVHIVTLVGWGSVAVRDLGLAGAALAIALARPAGNEPVVELPR
jgi:uncharacterized membrane protein YphA (DoxX/SURF4 family)